MCEIWGVMQGRLTDKGEFFPQQFPWESWEKEFSAARDLRIDCIEWMFNLENYESNPFIAKRVWRTINKPLSLSPIRSSSMV